MPIVRSQYEQVCEEIAKVLEIERDSQGRTLVEVNGGAVTFYHNRISDFDRLIESLPAIVVDVESSVINIDPDAGEQGIPVGVLLVVPLQVDETMDDADRAVVEQETDIRLKRLFSACMQILYRASGKGVVRQLLVEGGSMPHDVLENGDEKFGLKLRVGMINTTAWCYIDT